MENNNLNTGAVAQNTKTHTGWMIAAIALAVVLIGTVGVFSFFAVNSNNEKKELKYTIASQQSVQEEECPENTEVTTEDPIEEPHAPDEGNSRRYVVVKEWGVKIEIPDGLESIT